MNWLSWAKWSALAFTLAGALMTSAASYINFHPLNLLMLLIGCVLYVIWAWKIREANLVWLNTVLGSIHALGILTFLLALANNRLDS